jgi:hypothetical protein
MTVQPNISAAERQAGAQSRLSCLRLPSCSSLATPHIEVRRHTPIVCRTKGPVAQRNLCTSLKVQVREKEFSVGDHSRSLAISTCVPIKYWEIIACNLKKRGWSLGCNAALQPLSVTVHRSGVARIASDRFPLIAEAFFSRDAPKQRRVFVSKNCVDSLGEFSIDGR